MATQASNNLPSGVTPRPEKSVTAQSYLDLTQANFWTQQYLPEVYEKEVERFGKRTISGFLQMVGAEMPMTSDRIIWSEQGRLHVSFTNVTITDADGNDGTYGGNGGKLTMGGGSGDAELIPVGATVVIAKGSVASKARVMSVTGAVLAVEPYGHADLGAAGFSDADVCSMFIYGSEYAKGSAESGVSIQAPVTTFSNKPIILRDKFEVDGSDTAQIGWIEVTTEMGTTGYMWYLKSEHESRLRFMDQLEMAMVEAESTVTQAGATVNDALTGAKVDGSEGLFEAVEDRGIVFSGTDFDGAGGLVEIDDIIKQLDKQGSIEENMLFLNRAKALELDNMLAAQNSYGAGGTSYGVFENDEQIALNLGFTGFRRGSYDFYKSDWKYLNDPTTRGLVGDIEGIIVPAGTSSVYDEILGQNISRPFLHVRYRASQADDRRFKSWVTGSVGGNFTSADDVMKVHYLSERALCVQAANNFVLLKA